MMGRRRNLNDSRDDSPADSDGDTSPTRSPEEGPARGRQGKPFEQDEVDAQVASEMA